MEDVEKLFRQLVEARLDELGETASGLEKKVGLPEDAIRNVLRETNKRGPTLKRVKEVCDAVGWDLTFGLMERSGLGGEKAKKVVTPAFPEDAASEFSFIPKYEEYLSAGDGVFAGNEDPPELLPFSSNWLRQMGLTASSTMAVNIRGDSMEPTLADGDTVLIDRSRTSIVNGKVYAFNDVDGTSKVKRLQVTPEEFIIIRSDNPEYQALIRTGYDMEQVASGVIGQVVWSAHAWELNGG